MIHFVATTAMRIRHLLTLVAIAAPIVAPAQTPPDPASFRGRQLGLYLSDGEPISFLLENSRYLELTEEQRLQLMDVRRRLRAQTAPFMRQLDSLRELVGLSLEPRRRRADDAEALERFQRESRPIVDSIGVRNDVARREARLILDSLQLVRLDSLIQRQRRGERPPPA